MFFERKIKYSSMSIEGVREFRLLNDSPLPEGTPVSRAIMTQICAICPSDVDSMPKNIKEVKTLWSSVASCFANVCFDRNRQVNLESCEMLKDFIVQHCSGTPITQKPFCYIPGMELIRDQVLSVLGKIETPLPCGNGYTQSLASILRDIEKFDLNKFSVAGKQIIEHIAHVDQMRSISDAVHVILQSFFTPHRQISLPTCNMDAIIINETFNNPARLARIFKDILCSNPEVQINLASQNTITIQSPTEDCCLEVRPKEPENEDNQKYLLFKEEEEEIGEEEEMRTLEGISLIRNDKEETIGLKIPINDLNDVLLANLMQNVYGGDQGIVVTEGFIRSRELYFGIPGNCGFMREPIKCNPQKTEWRECILQNEEVENIPVHYFSLEAMRTLIIQAQQLKEQNLNIISTFFSQPNSEVDPANKIEGQFDLDKINGHVENLYLDSVIDIQNMKIDDFRIIGDRNWIVEDGEPVYLGIHKLNDQFVFTEMKISINPDSGQRQLNCDDGEYGEIGQICFYNQ